ncbi:SSI family serine proteinase inhibitor [Actinomadura oligospora]|uniref:SSI family serine proteinase inhibitor n=1 Tax=Actinomadura oligospora TaxID=111804 RepID=UPI0006848859|nr:SSI family serine proteinase inhibitor [Actinomadura oligospora]
MKHLVAGVLMGALTVGVTAAPAEGAVTGGRGGSGAHGAGGTRGASGTRETSEAHGTFRTHEISGTREVSRTREVVGRTVLRLTLAYPTGNTSGTRYVVLKCDPAGGNHPKAAGACADLAASGGMFDHRPTRNEVCPMIYHPVVARAAGRWRGRPVRFREQYGNDCIMRSRTGRVFDF